MLASIGEEGPNISLKGSMIVLDDDHPGGIFRVFGSAEIHERGEFRDKIRTLLQKREVNHEGAEEGFAVVIKLDKAENLRGVSLK